MKAVRNAPPSVEVVEIDEPDGPGELVRVVSTGICASDLMYLGFGSTQIAGHEFAGVRGRQLQPLPPRRAGPRHDGSRRDVEWFRAPKHALIPLPDSLASADAALVEPSLGVPAVAAEARHAFQHEARERIGASEATGEYDVVIETGGSDRALQRAVELARPGGTVVFPGTDGPDTQWPLRVLVHP